MRKYGYRHLVRLRPDAVGRVMPQCLLRPGRNPVFSAITPGAASGGPPGKRAGWAGRISSPGKATAPPAAASSAWTRLRSSPTGPGEATPCVLSTTYTILTPEQVALPVAITREIFYQGKSLGRTKSMESRVYNGTRTQEIDFTLPATAGLRHLPVDHQNQHGLRHGPGPHRFSGGLAGWPGLVA